ncbi:hypothetical protein TKK_0006927 [Trichogramma kaykai]
MEIFWKPDLTIRKLRKTSNTTGNDQKTLYYTGLPNAQTLFAIHETVKSYLMPLKRSCALTTFQQLVLTLIKLRLNLSFTDLAYRFNVSVSTVTRTFRKTVGVMAVCFSKLVAWPDRDILINANAKSIFSKSFPRITVIIDCFEIFIEGSDDLLANAESWSQYKHHKTIKVLIGITGQGSIRDVVLADRGFLIEDLLNTVGASLYIPAFTKGVNQLDPLDLEKTRKIANVRIHVERVIGGLKQKFQILSGRIPLDMLYTDSNGDSLIDEIILVCGALFDLCPSIISHNK